MSIIRGKVGLVDATGQAIHARPQPNPFTEERINRELAESFDPLLHIRWMPTAVYNPIHEEFEGRYALCCTWPSTDGRWQMVRDGKHDPAEAYDRVLWFCEDLWDASSVPRDPESIKTLVFEAIGKMDNTRYPWRDKLKKSVEANQALVEQRKAQAAAMMEEVATDIGRTTVGAYSKGSKRVKDLDLSGLEAEIAKEFDLDEDY